jgi:hypothetical protein
MPGPMGMITITVTAPYDNVLTCRRGSVILDLEVMQGTTNTTVIADDGSTAQLDVSAPNSTVSFETTTGTLAAGSENIHPLNVTFVGGGVDVDQEPRLLLPGDSLVVDTITPETAIDSVTVSQGINPIQYGSRTPSQDIIFQFSSPDSDVSVIECSLDNKNWEVCPNNVAAYDNLSEGWHFFSVRARDGAGNVDPTPYVFGWTIDTITPETAIDSVTDSHGINLIRNQSSTLSRDISFEFSSPDSDISYIFECRLDGGDWEVCGSELVGIIGETKPYSSYSDLPSGEHTIEVRARDGAGNVDPTPATLTWTVT